MKKLYARSFASWFGGIVFIMPAACFFLTLVLKCMLGRNFLSDNSWSIAGKTGVKESIDFNINPLILFVAVLILLLNTMTVLRLRFETTANRIDCRFSICKSGKTWQSFS